MSSNYPLVYIQWEDHWSEDQAWTHIKKLKKKHKKNSAYIIETVGFLLSENDVSIMVGLSVASDDMVDGNIVILKKNIKCSLTFALGTANITGSLGVA